MDSTLRDDFVRTILGASDEEIDRFEQARDDGIADLAPVVVPRNPFGDNNHMGWPVASMRGGDLVVVHRRIPGHNPRGAGTGDAHSTFSMVTVSSDGGEHWSPSIDLRESMDADVRNRGGELPLSHRYKFGPVNESREGYKIHLNAIGVDRSEKVHVICNYGAFSSVDPSKSWNHRPEEFREDRLDGDIVYLGPRIIDHPDFGLVAFGNTASYEKDGKFPNPVPGPTGHDHHNLVLLNSTNGGENWRKLTLPLPEWAAQHEPAALLHNGEFFVIGRDQITGTDHVQMRFREFTDTVAVQRTNMRNNFAIDTVDLDFNPVTRRFEVVRSKREAMRLDLYSIDPGEWESAEWRFEGTLFQRSGDFYSSGDGFHPAGAVIDEERGVQHIFIYTGHANGPAGSFRLTRTLDTPRLKAFLSPR